MLNLSSFSPASMQNNGPRGLDRSSAIQILPQRRSWPEGWSSWCLVLSVNRDPGGSGASGGSELKLAEHRAYSSGVALLPMLCSAPQAAAISVGADARAHLLCRYSRGGSDSEVRVVVKRE